MKSENYEKSNNQLPLSTDWHRYDCPTVLRHHGPEYLERFWRDGMTHRPKESVSPLKQTAAQSGGRVVIEWVHPKMVSRRTQEKSR